MYENHRDSFSHRNEEDDNRRDRWRRAEERYRREAQGQSYSSQSDSDQFSDDRHEANRRNQEFGYGRAYRDDDYGGRNSYGRDETWRDQRTYGAGRDRHDRPQVHWHERDRELRSGHPYQGTYGGTGDSSYFTGSQGSWAVGAPRTPSSFYGGNQHYGADYRQHGYDADDGRRGFWDRASDEVASWFGDDGAARRREQDHRGRGPQNYTRSDERIRDDANDKLTDDWRVDASNITVSVKDGEVTLNGIVASREAKRRAEDVVDDISGVKHVQNNLRVQTASASGTAYTGNYATVGSTTAEGGTISPAGTDPAKQTNKV
ncbi:MAG TPA: BON domain-containing protein [Novosphingobium sp.]